MDISPHFKPEGEVKDAITLTSNRLLAPDRDLLVWEKWIQIRREETTKLANKVNKQPVDLAMNLLDKVRQDNERKTALINAQLEKKATLRGGTTWERPLRLKQRCDRCCPAYEIKRTRAEMGNPRIIHHIGVPTYIKQEELGMAGESQRISSFRMNAGYESYLEKREKEFAEKIKQIDPFRPDIANLIVRGKNPPKKPSNMLPVPVISIDYVDNVQEEPLTGIYAIKINDSVFCKHGSGQNLVNLNQDLKQDYARQCSSWTYYFKIPVKRVGRSVLYLENLGTVALKYCWKKIRRVVSFIPEDNYEKVFFFNVNEDVLSPGQNKEICFTFISDRPGIYSESWELYMNDVSFFDDPEKKLTFDLYADTIEHLGKVNQKVEILKTRINRVAMNNIAVGFIDEIIDNVFVVPKPVYPYKHYFLEEQIFLMKNPVCFYHQTEIDKMKEQYTEMVPEGEWDLLIDSWRSAIMSKDYDDRMKYYKILKNFNSHLMKPWYEGEELRKEKHSMVKNLLGDLIGKFDNVYMSVQETLLDEAQPLGSTRNLHTVSKSTISDNPFTSHMARMIFYIRIYEHVSNTIEMCAGVLSSMDLNRWVEFGICKNS